jgi:hypothetical protein
VIKPVWAALCTGDVDVARAHVFHDILTPLPDDVAVALAAEYVGRASEWTTSQLRDRLRRAVLRADPTGATRRTAHTVERRHVSLMPGEHSTAGLFAVDLPAARAVAAFERVDAYARTRRHDGDPRTLDQLRADTLLDLLEGVNIGCPPVHRRGVLELTIPWSTLAAGLDPAAVRQEDHDGLDKVDDEPAVLAGFGPVEAPTARHLAAGLLDRDDIGWRLRITGAHGQLWQLGTLPTPTAPRMSTGWSTGSASRRTTRRSRHHRPKPTPTGAHPDPRWRVGSGPGTAPARHPAAAPPHPSATSTTPPTTPPAAKPHTTTSPCYAATTTDSNTRPAGR